MKKHVLFLTAVCIASPLSLRAQQETPTPSPATPVPTHPGPVTAPSGKAAPAIFSVKPDLNPTPKPMIAKKADAVVTPTPKLTPTAKPNLTKASDAKVSPTPKPKKFLWIFPVKTSSPKTEPAPASKVKPKVTSEEAAKPKVTPVTEVKPVPTPKPNVTPVPKPTVAPTTKPNVTPTPTTKEIKKQAKPTPVEKPAKLDEPVSFTTPEKPVDAKQSANALIAQDAQEKVRYNEVRTKALADPEVLKLQDKADTAGADEQKAASKAYYKALFDKMRSLDATLKDRIDRTEAANLRRIEQGK